MIFFLGSAPRMPPCMEGAYEGRAIRSKCLLRSALPLLSLTRQNATQKGGRGRAISNGLSSVRWATSVAKKMPADHFSRQKKSRQVTVVLYEYQI